MFWKVITALRLWTFLLGTTISFTIGVWWCRYFLQIPTNGRFCKQIQHIESVDNRPQSLQQELRTKQLLFIGIMTSQKFLDTRAKGVYDTWGKNVPGKLVFFAGKGKMQPRAGFPIVYLPVPDNGYPPQRKSLAMLKYIYDHYIEQFQWFIRADDDVYIRTKKLTAFLQKLDSSEKLLLGQAGVGKPEERGKLGLRDGDNFCMGGPGVIMSRGVLKKVHPHLEYCLNNTATFHEDTEVGRCLRNFAGVMCPWAYQAKELFHQVYENQADAYHGDLSAASITNAITLHPIKDPAYMRRLHVHYVAKEIHAITHSAWLLQHQLDSLNKATAVKTPSALFHDRVDFFGEGRNTSSWEVFNARQIFPVSGGGPMHWIHESTRDGLVNVVRKCKTTAQAKGEVQKYHTVRFGTDITGHMNVHPLLGAQYIIRMSTSKIIRGNKHGKPKQIFSKNAFKIQHPFSNLRYRKIEIDLHEMVHFIVPLAGRFGNFRRFLSSFENAFLRHDKRVKLLIVYSPKMEDPSKHKEVFGRYAKRYPKGVFHWLDVNADTFQRGLALNMGSKYFGRGALLSFVDVDLVFETEFLFRCRGNTKLGQQVYFPIMFSRFHPNISRTGKEVFKNRFTIHRDAGLWRFHSYGQVCVYNDDVDAVGGFNTTIKGWGMEDVNFFEKIVKHGTIDVVRSPDRGLVHVFHKHAACSPKSTLQQLKMCNDAKAAYLGSSSSVYDYLIRKRYLEIEKKKYSNPI